MNLHAGVSDGSGTKTRVPKIRVVLFWVPGGPSSIDHGIEMVE